MPIQLDLHKLKHQLIRHKPARSDDLLDLFPHFRLCGDLMAQHITGTNKSDVVRLHQSAISTTPHPSPHLPLNVPCRQ